MIEWRNHTGDIPNQVNRLAGSETMRQVTATEAKSHWGDLLRQVEAGETIAITRRGKVVAHLSPAEEHSPDENRQPTTWHEWAQMVKERRARLEGVTVSTEEIRSWIQEGWL